MDCEDRLIDAECRLRERQSNLGVSLIQGTCIVCILIGILPIVSGGMFNGQATCAQIVLSEPYLKLIISMSIPFIIGLTAGIILIKSSVKHIAKSYLDAPVDDSEDTIREVDE